MKYTTKLRKYCEEYENIENYELAKADNFHGWAVHHRDEIRLLPSGMIARRSADELKENGRYNNCPANELIFLTSQEHARLHHKGKKSTPWNKGKTGIYSEETLRRIGAKNGMKGKQHSEETRRKQAESARLRWKKIHDRTS